MAKLVWDIAGNRYYETGVSKGVLFPMSAVPGVFSAGVVWNGLVNVSQSPSGAEASAIYADNIKYLNLISVEELEASIEAYTYPDEFAECDGSAVVVLGAKIGQQPRKMFALSYQTRIGSDLNPELGYKIHIIYGCQASPSEKSHDTINDSPEAMTFSWDITTTPVDVTGYKPTASIEIDSTKTEAAKLAALELILYGTTGVQARVPFPQEIIELLTSGSATAVLTLTDEGDNSIQAVTAYANVEGSSDAFVVDAILESSEAAPAGTKLVIDGIAGEYVVQQSQKIFWLSDILKAHNSAIPTRTKLNLHVGGASSPTFKIVVSGLISDLETAITVKVVTSNEAGLEGTNNMTKPMTNYSILAQKQVTVILAEEA